MTIRKGGSGMTIYDALMETAKKYVGKHIALYYVHKVNGETQRELWLRGAYDRAHVSPILYGNGPTPVGVTMNFKEDGDEEFYEVQFAVNHYPDFGSLRMDEGDFRTAIFCDGHNIEEILTVGVVDEVPVEADAIS